MTSTSVEKQLAEIRDKLTAIEDLLRSDKADRRASYSVEEVAEMLDKSTYTIREWCRLGRINACKIVERRGKSELWSIAAGEVTRIREKGLLPFDPRRNAAH